MQKDPQQQHQQLILGIKTQTALLSVNAANGFESFGPIAENLVETIFPNTIRVLGFVFSPVKERYVYTCSGKGEEISQEHLGLLLTRNSTDKKVLSFSGFQSDDPLLSIIPEAASPLPHNHNVYLWPVVGDNQNVLVFFLIVTSSKVSENQLLQLDFFDKQICTSYQNIVRNHTATEHSHLKILGGMYEKSFAVLSQKIITVLQDITEASSGLILAVDHSSEELYHKVKMPNGTFVEKRIELAGTFFEDIVKNGSKINVAEISKESIYRNQFSSLSDILLNSMLCIPVTNEQTKEIFCICCLFNEKSKGSFTQLKEELVCNSCNYFYAQLYNALEWEKELMLRRQQEHLLNVAKNLFLHLDDVTVLLTEILQEARSMTQAEVCSLFLIDKERKELVSKVFNHPGRDGNSKENDEVRIPLGHGVAGHVAQTGMLLNIKDAYSHPLFCSDVDKETGFKTRNILCFPIKDGKDVIGVGQLVNKLNGPAFTRFDEDLTQGFATFCGISICHSLLYKKVIDAQNRDKITNELMIYHMKVTPKDVKYYAAETILKPREVHSDFNEILFRPRLFPDLEYIKACLSMFEEMNLIKKWKISYETLIRFILMVKKGYRDVPYHNWTHAFTVSHFCYLLYKNLNQIKTFSDIEVLSLLVSCLCHDLDHRGTNNAFQVSYNSVLAALYSSEGSVMERHHFAQACCILNTEGCNIFENLSGEEYHSIMELTRKLILATDLSHHFKILNDLKRVAVVGFNPKDETERELLLYLMMTSCDLSDQVKPFDSASKAADLVYAEFFSQGDLEKAMGNKPSEMMDRERACIPKLQIDFIENIVYPSYRLLADIFPEMEVLCTVINENKEQWKAVEASGDYRRVEQTSTNNTSLSTENTNDRHDQET